MFSNSKKTFNAHLGDLRLFLILNIVIFLIIFGICFYYADYLFFLLAKPLLASLEKNNIYTNFIITDITEVFFSQLKIAFYFAAIGFTPIALLLGILFLYPAFNKYSKKIIITTVCLIPVLFCLGFISTYYFGLGVIWDFFIKFSLKNTDIRFLPSVADYISLVLKIIFATGLAFELPVVILILGVLNFITPKSIIKYGRYAIVGAFIIGAIFTPPDPLSQIMMAGVLIVLYYLSYFLLKILR
jgi:sec-independent protein translocase protein TatC